MTSPTHREKDVDTIDSFERTEREVRLLQKTFSEILENNRNVYIDDIHHKGRDISDFKEIDITQLNSSLILIKTILEKMEALTWFKLQATDNRAETSQADITKDIHSYLNKTYTLLSLRQSFFKEIPDKRKSRSDYLNADWMFDFYFKCKAISGAIIIK